MKVLCVSDYHKKEDVAKNVENIAKKENVDAIINCGDFLSESFAKNVLDKTKFRTFVVRGNWDDKISTDNKKVSILVNEVVKYKDFYFLGINWGHYEEIKKLAKGIDRKKLIVISHDPPFGILDLTFYGSNAGMPELREIIEKIKPSLHVFGHIHESAGFLKHKGTLYVNAALPEFRKAILVKLPEHRVKIFDV
ncbi:MAG: metallophosphoesterase family protein [Candidatus Aenigmatarchaeota archaeon]